MKHVTYGLKYTLKWALFAWSQGPILSNLGELAKWISVLLANLNMLGGSNPLRKMGWNYPSGALCLIEHRWSTVSVLTLLLISSDNLGYEQLSY